MNLLYMATSWAVGIWLTASITGVDKGLLAAAGLLTALAGLPIAVLARRRERLLRRIGLCLIAAGLGAARFTATQPHFTANDLAFYNDQGRAELIGVVVDDPDVRDANIRLRVEITSRDGQPVNGLALIYAPRLNDFAYGDRVRVFGEPQTPPEFDTFSFRDYLARGGVYSVVRNARVVRLERDTGDPFRAAMFRFRADARDLLTRLLPDPESSLLAGIVLGDERGLAPDVAEAFRRTNTSHLIAISGANMAVITALLLAILSRLTRRWPTVLLTILGLTLYTIFVGATPSVVRAAIMAALSLLALRFGRQNDGLTALAASAWIMTVLNPNALFDLGLILSVLATLGLILYADPLAKAVERALTRLVKAARARQIVAMLSDTVLITVTAQITTLPVILLINGQMSPLALPVNALVAPAQPPILVLGLLAILLGAIFLPAGQVIAWFAAVPTAFTLTAVRGAAGAPTFPIPISPAFAVAYYTALFAITALASQHPEVRTQLVAWLKGRAAALMLGSAGLAAAVLIWAAVLARPDGLLRLAFLEVGEGSAVLIQTPRGAHVLIDGGENPTRLATALGDRLPFLKQHLDLLIVTEARPTAIAALPPLLERYRVGAAVTPVQVAGTTSGAYRALLTALQTSGAPVQAITAGWQVMTDDGVQIEAIYPNEAALNVERPAPDDAPLILRVRYGEAVFLLVPDVSERGAAALAAQAEASHGLKATVLHVPSNGAAASNPAALLDAVDPQVALIVAEAGNPRARPAESTLAALADTTIYRTDQHGTVEMATDGATLWITTGR